MTTHTPTKLQKALLVETPLASFTLRDIPKYVPGPGEILIKVHAVGLNPADWKMQKEGAFNDIMTFPAVLGVDIAGEVDETGEGVTNLQRGDRVFGSGTLWDNEKGGFQQYTLALASTTAKIPSNISYDEAASIPVAIITAYVGLYNRRPYGLGLDAPIALSTLGKYSGNPIIVLGGSSAVGQSVIQLAKISGFSPIITTASIKHAEALKGLGADVVLARNLSTEELRQEISKHTSKPISLIYDAVSLDSTLGIAANLLAPNGTLVTTRPDVIRELDQGKTIIREVSILRLEQNMALLEDLFQNHLSGWVEKGLVHPNRIDVLPNGLLGIPDGLGRLERDEISRLKLVAHPQETP